MAHRRPPHRSLLRGQQSGQQQAAAGHRGAGEVGHEFDQRPGKDIGDDQVVRRARRDQRVVESSGDGHRDFARATAQSHVVQPRILDDHVGADAIDVARGGQRARPQRQRGEGEQAGAGADIGAVAHHHPAGLHRGEHGEATRGRRVLAGAERLARGDGKAAHRRIVARRVIGGADLEHPGADGFEVLLAARDPVGVGQLLFRPGGRLREQRVQSAALDRRRTRRHPRFELPVVGAILGDFASGDDDVGVPVERILVRDERRRDDFARGEGDQLPAHLAALSCATRVASPALPRSA